MSYEAAAGELLLRHRLTLATAESLTGGQVGQMITAVAGASNYYRGGIISYATEVKEQVLKVEHATLADHGPVSRQAALEMAANVREIFGASIGLSTTGVAGPTEQDGHPVGTLHIGIAHDGSTACVTLHGPAGSRAEIRSWAAREALEVLVDHLRKLADQPDG